jgi:Sigma-54 interaction domain
MSKPTRRDGSPSPVKPTCPKCGSNAIRTSDVPGGDSELEYLSCDQCQYLWPVARGSKHVGSVARPRVIMEETTLPRRPHLRGALTPLLAPEEWDCVTDSRLNALVIGPRRVTGRLIRSLRSQLAPPIIHVFSHMALVLPPADQAGTIILEDVGRLDRAAQMYLLQWLDGAGSRTRIIGTSTIPLLGMVAAGTFDGALYYRLNLVYVRC